MQNPKFIVDAKQKLRRYIDVPHHKVEGISDTLEGTSWNHKPHLSLGADNENCGEAAFDPHDNRSTASLKCQ